MSKRTSMSRRELLAGGLGLAGSLLVRPEPARAIERLAALRPPVTLDPLAVALRAERWIRASRRETPEGVVWPSDPLAADPVDASLYYGPSGIVLFLLELHHVTGDGALLDEARRGADALIATLPAKDVVVDAGFYTGIAGTAFALAETARATAEARYRRAAVQATEYVMTQMDPAGPGEAWRAVTDIIAGAAGVALYLRYAQRTLGVDALPAARRLGQHLVGSAEPEPVGRKWRMAPETKLTYPNFSHGTAGVAYALATIGEATGDGELVAAALEGAAYLDAVADRSAGCRVFHHEPGGEQLFYLSWCHGGAGTARLYHRLAAVTGEARWRDAVQCSAASITALGAPEQRSPGYWENISQCCGNAGVGELFLGLYRNGGARAHLEVAERAAADILQRATEEHGGLKWVQAEHRVRPEQRVAQTGLMQGAAGVGLFMLRLHAARTGAEPFVQLPDNPFFEAPAR